MKRRLIAMVVAFVMILNLFSGFTITAHATETGKQIDDAIFTETYLYYGDNQDVQARQIIMDETGKVLTEGVDYTVSIIEEGNSMYNLCITGMGDYFGEYNINSQFSIGTLCQDANWEYIVYGDDEDMWANIISYTGELSTVEVPEYVEYEGSEIYVSTVCAGAFLDNSKLTSITLGDVSLEERLIIQCDNLERLTIESERSIDGEKLIVGDVAEDFVITAPDTLTFYTYSEEGDEIYTGIEAYCLANGYTYQNFYTYYVADGWKYRIRNEWSADIVSYTGTASSITIPQYVTYDGEQRGIRDIDKYAFSGLTALKKIDFNYYDLTTISDSIIKDCSSLEKVTMQGAECFNGADFIEGAVAEGFVLEAYPNLSWTDWVYDEETEEEQEVTVTIQDWCTQKGYTYKEIYPEVEEMTLYHNKPFEGWSGEVQAIAGTEDTLTLSYTIGGDEYSDTENITNVSYTSSNEEVATIDSEGNITYNTNLSEGTKITVTAKATIYGKEYTASTIVDVFPALTYVDGEYKTLFEGESFTMPEVKKREFVYHEYEEDGSIWGDWTMDANDITEMYEASYASKDTDLITVNGTAGEITVQEDACGTATVEASYKIGDVTYPVIYKLYIKAKPEVSELPFELPSVDGEVLDIYTYNEEIGSTLENFFAVYPQYKDKVKFHINPSAGDYSEIVEAAFNSEEKPDLIVWDTDPIRYAVEQDYVADLSDIGFQSTWYSKAYPYTITLGSKGDALRAVTWQSMPSCFVYRADIAQKVFGTSDPAEIQKMVCDWDTFLATAEKLKKKGYAMVSGTDAMNLSYFNTATTPWIADNTINLNSCATSYLNFTKQLYDNGYTNNNEMWSDGWSEDFDGNVFGFQGVEWFINYVMTPQEHANDYKICQGPANFGWGGSYITATTECDNKELAKLILYTITCDDAYMKQVSINEQEFANNSVANQAIYEADNTVGKGNLQNNPYPIWMDVAENITAVQDSYDALTLKNLTDEIRREMCSETTPYATMDDAIKELKKRIQATFPNMTIVGGDHIHSFSKEWTMDVPATCSVAGSKSRHCVATGCTTKTDVTAIPATGVHTFDAGVIKTLPTCVNAGEKIYTCTVCGQTKSEPVEATGTHVYGDWVETKAPLCNEDGEKTRTCNSCGHQEKEVIPKTGFVKGGEFEKGKVSYTIKTTKGKKGTVVYEGTEKKSKKVKVPKTVKIEGKTYTVTEIAEDAFKDDTKMTSVTIPEGITKIGKNAFSGCKKLKTITIKSTKLKTVGKNAIKGIDKKATIKVPSKQLSKYKKLFKSNTGFKKTMKVKS